MENIRKSNERPVWNKRPVWKISLQKRTFYSTFQNIFTMCSETDKKSQIIENIFENCQKQSCFEINFLELRGKCGKLINVLYQIRTSCVENFLKINKRPVTFI